MNDFINQAYVLIYASTCFIAPIIGSQIQSVYGQRTTFDIMALFNFIVGFISFYFNCGIDVFEENKEFQ